MFFDDTGQAGGGDAVTSEYSESPYVVVGVWVVKIHQRTNYRITTAFFLSAAAILWKKQYYKNSRGNSFFAMNWMGEKSKKFSGSHKTTPRVVKEVNSIFFFGSPSVIVMIVFTGAKKSTFLWHGFFCEMKVKVVMIMVFDTVLLLCYVIFSI